MHGVWTSATSMYHVHETQLLRIRYHVYPRAQGTNTVHQLSRAVINIQNEDEQGNGRQESEVDKQPEHKIPQQDMKAKIALHYLNKDIGDSRLWDINR